MEVTDVFRGLAITRRLDADLDEPGMVMLHAGSPIFSMLGKLYALSPFALLLQIINSTRILFARSKQL